MACDTYMPVLSQARLIEEILADSFDHNECDITEHERVLEIKELLKASGQDAVRVLLKEQA